MGQTVCRGMREGKLHDQKVVFVSTGPNDAIRDESQTGRCVVCRRT